MRISDWSSDVCSSDLALGSCADGPGFRCVAGPDRAGSFPPVAESRGELGARGRDMPRRGGIGAFAGLFGGAAQRSEEHTSELQSLMRNSYAVFCLKKKRYTTTTQYL